MPGGRPAAPAGRLQTPSLPPLPSQLGPSATLLSDPLCVASVPPACPASFPPARLAASRPLCRGGLRRVAVSGSVAARLRGPAIPLSVPILTCACGPAVACNDAHVRNRRPAPPPACVCCFASGALGVLSGALRSPTALCARSPGLRRCLQPCPPARLRCLGVVTKQVACPAVCPQRVTAPGLCHCYRVPDPLADGLHPHPPSCQRTGDSGVQDGGRIDRPIGGSKWAIGRSEAASHAASLPSLPVSQLSVPKRSPQPPGGNNHRGSGYSAVPAHWRRCAGKRVRAVVCWWQ
jgi:hypothetical protein